MAVLTEENQKVLEGWLVERGIVDQAKLDDYRAKAKADGQPVISQLIADGLITNEKLTELTAKISSVPYVNLLKASIDPKVLALLPKETAERYMAVPLGELDKRLAVAMLDANNVQAVDFLSNKIERPLKVYMASEEGIQQILNQYKTDLERGVSEAIASSEQPDTQPQKGKKKADKEDEALVISQDSPISRALNTILEYAVRSGASD
ncbi:MAG TPA: type II/IV secretion system protein, partial [Candidatus Saccharimonadales bacterium]|nr:type II/IV secretion system protein [Candidatus Saccharimonadales bacterium]